MARRGRGRGGRRRGGRISIPDTPAPDTGFRFGGSGRSGGAGAGGSWEPEALKEYRPIDTSVLKKYRPMKEIPPLGSTPSFKRGGTMKRRGVARLHKGERIMGRKGRGRSR